MTETSKTKTFILEEERKTLKLIPEYSNNKIENWSVYQDNKIVSSKIRQAKKVKFWKTLLQEHLNSCEVTRILIVGGADQVIANLALRYPANITIVDPYCFMYLKPPFNKFFRTKPFINKISEKDLELRKLVLLDMELSEAIEDESLDLESFDLIIVDKLQDDFYDYSSIYTKEYSDFYKKLLKPNGVLIINNLFDIIDLNNPLDIISFPQSVIREIKQTNKIYRAYLSRLSRNLVLENSLREGSYIKIDIYRNSHKVSL